MPDEWACEGKWMLPEVFKGGLDEDSCLPGSGFNGV